MTSLPRPEVTPPAPWSFPQPEHHRLRNGIEVLLHHLPGQHVISTTVLLDHELAGEPRASEGVTAMVARLLTEGTVAHPGERFAELLENCGAAMGHDVGQTGVQVMMDVPAPNLDPAVALVAEAVRHPELGADDVHRHVDLRLAEIAQRAANSAATATVEFRRRVVGSEHRVGRPVGGETDQVQHLTPELVRSWADEVLRPDRTRIVVGGDLGGGTGPDTAGVLALLEERFGDWDTGEPSDAVEHPTPGPGAPGCTVVDRPGAVQADVRLGGWGVDRFDPRWPALRVAGYAMGGAFNSRLNTVLREEKGYTYGVRLGFTPLRSGGWFAAQGSFRTEVVGDAVALAREILDVRTDGFTADEVRDAQQYLTGATPLQYATADGVVDQAALQLLMGLPDDYLDQSLAAVLSVDPDLASEGYASVVDPDRLTCVVVGDAAAVVPQLEAAGLSPTVQAEDT